MSVIYALFLGILQGLTEFLPVSSSGHLVIVQSFISGFGESEILFDVILHLGTVFAVLIYFRKRIVSFLKLEYLKVLFLATLPASFFGLLFNNQIESVFSNIRLTGLALLVTGILNLSIDRYKTSKMKIGSKNALVIGIAQAIAIIPGISRSGSTIFAGVMQGIDRKKAVEFSFILSIPIILGANILEISANLLVIGGNWSSYLIGFITAVVAGYISIKFMLEFISRKKFKYFGYYCIALGLLCLMMF